LDFDLIETPENVELQRRLAGIGSRFIAGFLDTMILLLLLVLLLVVALVAGLGMSTFGGGGAWSVAILIVLIFLLQWGYFVFYEMVTNGQSPGKRNQHIRVVEDGGGPITFIDVAIRNLLRAVDFMPGGYAVAGVFMFFTKKAQRLGDLAAGTVVVSEVPLNYSAREGKGKSTQWEPPVSAEALRGSGFTPADFRVLSNYMIRRSELTLEARDRLVRTLLVPILERNGVAVSGKTTATIETEAEQLVRQATAGEAGSAPPPGGSP